MEIEIPATWSEADIQDLFKYINTLRNVRETPRQGPKHHCYYNEPCRFWHQTGEENYQGYCGLGSCDCITAVFNGKNPTRWMLKE